MHATARVWCCSCGRRLTCSRCRPCTRRPCSSARREGGNSPCRCGRCGRGPSALVLRRLLPHRRPSRAPLPSACQQPTCQLQPLTACRRASSRRRRSQVLRAAPTCPSQPACRAWLRTCRTPFCRADALPAAQIACCQFDHHSVPSNFASSFATQRQPIHHVARRGVRARRVLVRRAAACRVGHRGRAGAAGAHDRWRMLDGWRPAAMR